ncbi:ABC transporter permease [Edaphobacter albus]|uniref:ABC transporter permease n=1 Tax=Edaphobacter sp. 4G125 TaxID=2763071 RepID=UPI001644D61F|nr:ABC transporter permease [Edaphobacter sp. 4G125]QNI37051.1 ABC transporter permease [Edaphobacter sp. 4G125]
MTVLIQDIRYALRQLRKTPGFTATVLLTIALGIGANAAIFTLVNSVLLQNLPVADPATLVHIGEGTDCCVNGGAKKDGNYSLFPTETYQYLKKNAPEFEELAAMQAGYAYRPLTVRRDGADSLAQSAQGEFVSGNYFRTFGLRPNVGRLFTDSDDVEGAPMTGVMSYSTWQKDYNADPSVVGSTFWVNTKPVTVVGVAPRGFFGDRVTSTPPEFYLPIQSMDALSNASFVKDPRISWLYLIGRTKMGTAMVPLQQKVNALLKQEFTTLKDYKGPEGENLLSRVHATLTPGGAGIQAMQKQYTSHLHLLMWVAGLVLLIACANIANLLLVRGMNRRTEMSVRTALGAQRMRIVRQLLTESVVLSVLGGIAGLAVAYLGAKMLLALAFPGATSVTINAAPSLPIVGFAFALSLVTGVLFGVAPAWMAAKAEPADALRSGTRTTTGGASLLQRSLVVLQAALSVVLLVGAGLFAQSLSKLESTDMKLNATNRYIVHINPQAAGYATTQAETLNRTIENNFRAIPGIVKVGLASYTPMEEENWSSGIQVQGQPDPHKGASFVKINSEYLDSVGTHVVMGRGFGPQDTSTSPATAVVNQSFVKQFLNGENPIGRRFGEGKPEAAGDYEIVGVVEDTAYVTVRWKDHSMFFLPLTQRAPSDTKTPIEKDTSLYAYAIVIQTDRPMNNMESLTRRTLAAINPNLTVVKFQTFSEQIAGRFTEERLIARLTTLFGLLALLLATIGLYGVTAYGVARRTSEIGIRMALGAERGSVVAMILRGAMLQTVIGLAIGAPVAFLCVRFVKSQLYEISHASVAVMALAMVTLTVAACIAGVIPARRAASIDPVQALRTE